jgi:cytochrome c biogenesis protein CcdA/thiol-disulfide isomerase/thioredoxin
VITLVLVGLVGGLITGISPCILPVLPVVFLSGGAQGARSRATPRGDHGERPYLVVAGLVLSFSVFTLIGTLVLDRLPLPADIIRWTGLVVLVLLGLGMIVPRVEQLLEKPFSRIPQRRVGTERGAFALGLALGAVYVPCAGPVLAAITVAGATGRIGLRTVALTLAFALGTAVPLLFFALAGRGLAERLRLVRQHQRRIRAGAGVVVIALAVALTFNVTEALQRAVPDYTAALNRAAGTSERAAQALSPTHGDLGACVDAIGRAAPALGDCGPAPTIAGISTWLNTTGGAAPDLRGHVVLVDFWAYSCINCHRAIAHVNAWYSAYRGSGLEVIGVHTPEYAFEHEARNVTAGARRLGIRYPVALDNDYTTWENYQNQSWPADYLIDAEGRVRFVSAGEGRYPQTEALIRSLLTRAAPGRALPPATDVPDRTPKEQYQSSETYLGVRRAEFYGGDDDLEAGTRTYRFPAVLPEGTFAVRGTWAGDDESLTAGRGAGLELSYLARDIYLDVGGTGTVTATLEGRTTTHRISGAPNIYTLRHGDEQGTGIVTITLSPGLRVYSFTFG